MYEFNLHVHHVLQLRITKRNYLKGFLIQVSVMAHGHGPSNVLHEQLTCCAQPIGNTCIIIRMSGISLHVFTAITKTLQWCRYNNKKMELIWPGVLDFPL